jgi:hypothetical protein
MKKWPWGFFFCSALAGCEKAPSLPIPPIDAAAPTEIETATFALG